MKPIEDIALDCIDLAKANRGRIKHALSRILVVAVVALLLEIFLFNMNYFRSATYEPINLSDRISLDANDTVRQISDWDIANSTSLLSRRLL